MEKKLMVTWGGGRGRGTGVGINWKTGTDTYILLYLTQITDKVLLSSTGNPL